ncbi:MAG: cytochrome ubiquinol oxidase subunit, partial [Rhizobacter sp.]|nr:cytochrome ubiquinol oxidase subunit [Rhizobacter sp.]
GVSAWQTLRRKGNASTPKVLRVGLTLAAVLIPVQIFVGDAHGLNTLEHQPAKVAAMEGLWHTEKGAPLVLFALPDETTKTNRFALEIPQGASLILHHGFDKELRGINEFEGAHPPVGPVFWSFRVMVGMGMLMLATSWFNLWWLRRRQWNAQALPPMLLRLLSAMTFSGWVATLAGWWVTEIGRQPFIVYGLLKTADVASDKAAPMILTSLIAYLVLYALLLFAYVAVVKYMAEKPEEVLADEAREQSATPPGAITSGVANQGSPS